MAMNRMIRGNNNNPYKRAIHKVKHFYSQYEYKAINLYNSRITVSFVIHGNLTQL